MDRGDHLARAEALLRAACQARNPDSRARLRRAAVSCIQDIELLAGSEKAIAETLELIKHVNEVLHGPCRNQSLPPKLQIYMSTDEVIGPT